MKRKVIKHGRSTLTISLPYRWTKELNVKKGDELIVEEVGKNLAIKTSDKNYVEKTFDIGDMEKYGTMCITSSYRSGVDIVNLTFSNPDFIKKAQKKILTELKGFEIVSQTKNSCVIKELMEINVNDLEISQKRLWDLIILMAEDILNAIKTNDEYVLKEIPERDNSINRLMNYIVRIVNKLGNYNNIQTYYIAKILEDIGDQYKKLTYEYILEKNATIEFKQLLCDINKNLKKLKELYYDYDDKKADIFFQNYKKIQNKLLDTDRSSSYNCLLNINNKIGTLIFSLMEIRI